MTKKLTYLLTNFVLLGFLSATAILCYLYISSRNDIWADGEKIDEQVIDIDGFYPGRQEEVNYDVRNRGDYSLSIAFREKDRGAILNDYLVVSVRTNGNYELTAGLKDVLNKGRISVGDNVRSVSFSYALPETAGNATQNQSTSFYVDLITRRKQ